MLKIQRLSSACVVPEADVQAVSWEYLVNMIPHQRPLDFVHFAMTEVGDGRIVYVQIPTVLNEPCHVSA